MKTEDIQKCRIGEDIIHDPYYTTKLINKMRLFSLFRMGAKRLKFEEEQNKKGSHLAELQKIQDAVVSQAEREMLVRQEMKKVQEELSRRGVELEKIKQSYEGLENEKTKLKILMLSKDKKIEQRERELEEMKKRAEEGSLVSIGEKDIERESKEELPKINNLRKERKYSKAKPEKSAFLTNFDQTPPESNTISLYERFELSNKDSSWREKCEQLYMENKRMAQEMERLQNSIPSTPVREREGHSLNLRNKRNF